MNFHGFLRLAALLLTAAHAAHGKNSTRTSYVLDAWFRTSEPALPGPLNVELAGKAISISNWSTQMFSGWYNWPHDPYQYYEHTANVSGEFLIEDGVPIVYKDHANGYAYGEMMVRYRIPDWATAVEIVPDVVNPADGWDYPLRFEKSGQSWIDVTGRPFTVHTFDADGDGYDELLGDSDYHRGIMTTYYSGCGCSTCPDHSASSIPSFEKLPLSSDAAPSVALPFGGDCCGMMKSTRISWAPDSLVDAVNPQAVLVNSFDLIGGQGIRIPEERSSPLQQIKIGETLGTLTSADNSIAWRNYDATGIAPRLEGGTGPFPLVKDDDTPLPLLDEVVITQESADSVLYENRKSGLLVAQVRMTYDAVQNTWETEDILSSSRETMLIQASGSGWITTTERHEKNSSGTWKLVASDSITTETINGIELVVEESIGAETVAEHGYDTSGRRIWTTHTDGSWSFFEHGGATGYSVYTPYGDRGFDQSEWNPTPASLAGIRCDSYTGAGRTRRINGILVGSSSTNVSPYGLYGSLTESVSNGNGSWTIAINRSDFVFDGFRGKALLEDDGRGVTRLHEYTRGTVDANGFTPSATGSDLMEVITSGDSYGDLPDLVLYDSEPLVLHPITVGASFPDAATREVRVYDSKGRTICSATQILDGSDYAVATQTVRTYTSFPDNEGEVVTETRDGRPISTISRLSDGTWEQHVDDAGGVTTTTRDLLGRVITETSQGPDGAPISRSYDYDGLTTTVTTSGGGLSLTSSETRDLRGRIVSFTDETGIVTTYAYTDGGRTTTITRPGGVSETTTHYLDGRFKQRSGSGVIREFASYAIESSGNEVTTRSSGPAVSGGHGARWTVSTTDTLGRTVSIRRPGPPDGAGGRHADVTETYIYDSATGKLAGISSSARPGLYRLMESDLLGNWSASGTATHTGPLVANSSDRFSSTAKTYEKRNGRFWEVTTHSTYVQGTTPVTSSTAVRLWAGDGEAIEHTDAANVTTSRITTYDPGDKTVTTTSGSALEGTTVETTVNGFLATRSLPGAPREESFAYDGLGRTIRHTDVRNASTHTIYNHLGQVEKVVDHLGQSQTYTYYPWNHLSAGRVHTQTDAAGKVTETTYDTLGRVTSVGGSAAYPVSHTYDDFGDRQTLTTYGTHTAVTTWVHDPPTGLLLEKKYHGQADGVKYTYFANGNLKSRVWRRGVDATYGYNTFGDLTSITYPDNTPDVTFSNFDRLGRPGMVTEGASTTALAYDTLTGETSTTYSGGHGVLPGLSVVMKSPDSGRPGGYTFSQGTSPLADVTYQYDDFGRFGGLTSGDHQVVYNYHPGTATLRETTHNLAGGGTPRIETRAIDLAGRTTGVVTTVPDGVGRRIAASAGYMVNQRGLREKLTREDGTSWTFGYNDRSEVTSGVKKLANGDLAAGLQFAYHYDGIGNRQWAKSGGNSSGENLRPTTYTPDALNQYAQIATPGSFDVLARSPDPVGVEVNGSPVTVTAQGDFHRAEATAGNANGAWVEVDVTSPPGTPPSVTGHRWLPPATFVPTYDDDGNLLEDGRWAYTWDAENRLVSQTTTPLAAAAGVPRRKIEHTYDWQSRRIRKTVSSSTNGNTWTLQSDERFLYNAWNPLAIFDASVGTLTLKQTCLWGLDLSGTLQGAGGVGGLLATTSHSALPTCHFPSYDGNGNIIAWTASNGDTLQRIDYDPFGNVVTRENAPGFEAPAWGFSTKYQDKETGLLYYGFRFYDPVAGRWPSRDPIEEEGGINLYELIGNDAVNWWDLLGLWHAADGRPRGTTNDYTFTLDGKGGYIIVPGKVGNNPLIKKAANDHEARHIASVQASADAAAIPYKQVYCVSKDGTKKQYYLESSGGSLVRKEFKKGDDMLWPSGTGVQFSTWDERKAEELKENAKEISDLQASGSDSGPLRRRISTLQRAAMIYTADNRTGDTPEWTAFKKKIAEEKKAALDHGYEWSWADPEKVYSEIK